ncbi:hypothetical protein PQX77_007338 [Marasmius sp. AFHP31]|nr:hypothetical protein PQX77_007338 [Marasmius sp. AFHP31]
MDNGLPSNGFEHRASDTNNYGDRSKTYNNSTLNYNNNTYSNNHTRERRASFAQQERSQRSLSTALPRSGIEILADHIAPTALHSSSSRNIRTGCQEGTRVAIIEELVRWIDDPSKKDRACWVQGGLGVGKSAVAQTICEKSRRSSQLAASFFFSRNDTQRSTLDLFFPTIAHQLATLPELVNAGLTPCIDRAVQQSTNRLDRMNLEGQFEMLIHRPCVQIDAMRWENLPRLVIIDGFDECMGAPDTTSPNRAQEALLSIIQKATSANPPLPLHFMIFSRPERTIFDFFQNNLPHHPVDMRSFRSEADNDVRKYLKKEFADLSDSQPELLVAGPWPGEQVIETLVVKADGHFIYVVTVMKYIISNRPSLEDLRERLDSVLHTNEPTSHPDLSDLDQLYHTVLRRFGKGDTYKRLLLPVLQFMVTPHLEHALVDRSPGLVAAFLKIDLVQCSAFLAQLRSVLHVAEVGQRGDVSILHTSFSDFLGEARRSHEFHVEPIDEIPYLDCLCCSLLFNLGRKIRQYRGEPMEIKDRFLELWSLQPCQVIRQLLTVKPAVKVHTELASAVTDFDLYEYLHMVLDPEYSKEMFKRLGSIKPCSRYLNPSSGLIKLDFAPFLRFTDHRDFFDYLFVFFIHNVICMHNVCNTLKLTPEEGRGIRLRQFFNEDWLIVLPKHGRHRKMSLTRLGCLALSASCASPRILLDRVSNQADNLLHLISERENSERSDGPTFLTLANLVYYVLPWMPTGIDHNREIDLIFCIPVVLMLILLDHLPLFASDVLPRIRNNDRRPRNWKREISSLVMPLLYSITPHLWDAPSQTSIRRRIFASLLIVLTHVGCRKLFVSDVSPRIPIDWVHEPDTLWSPNSKNKKSLRMRSIALKLILITLTHVGCLALSASGVSPWILLDRVGNEASKLWYPIPENTKNNLLSIATVLVRSVKGMHDRSLFSQHRDATQTTLLFTFYLRPDKLLERFFLGEKTMRYNSWTDALPLKVYPHGEIGRATTEVVGNKFDVYSVSLQQRIQFGEEIARTAQSDGEISATTIDDLVVRILMSRPSQLKDSAGESRSKVLLGLRVLQGLFLVLLIVAMVSGLYEMWTM